MLALLYMAGNARKWTCPDCGSDHAASITQCECGYEISTATAPVSPLRGAGENWRVTGWIITVCGVIGASLALFMDTSISTSVPADLYSSRTTEIVNFELLFRKGLAVGISLFAIGAGLFCIAVGAIIAAIRG